MGFPNRCFLLDQSPTLAMARLLHENGATCTVWKHELAIYAIRFRHHATLIGEWCRDRKVSNDKSGLAIRELCRILFQLPASDSVWSDPVVQEFFGVQLQPYLEFVYRRVHLVPFFDDNVAQCVWSYLNSCNWEAELMISLLLTSFQSLFAPSAVCDNCAPGQSARQ
jgi:hypothetical protein